MLQENISPQYHMKRTLSLCSYNWYAYRNDIRFHEKKKNFKNISPVAIIDQDEKG